MIKNPLIKGQINKRPTYSTPVKYNAPPKVQVVRKPIAITLNPAPKEALGLEQSTVGLDDDLQEFVKLCNELAFNFWRATTAQGISSARSLVLSPFAITSMLAMVFMGARGGTSGEMNELLRLDDMITFNPHLVFRNISDGVTNPIDSGIATSVIVRELFSDRAKGKLLQFYKDKALQFYSGHVEEASYSMINDIIRRRTNILMKRATMGKIAEYLKSNTIWLNPPLSAVSSNVFQVSSTNSSFAN